MKYAQDNNFLEMLDTDKLVLVDFFATWCMPCKMQGEVLAKLEKSRMENLDIIKVDVDNATNLAQKYEVSSIPTLVLIKDKKVVKKSVGFMSEKELLDFILNV